MGFGIKKLMYDLSWILEFWYMVVFNWWRELMMGCILYLVRTFIVGLVLIWLEYVLFQLVKGGHVNGVIMTDWLVMVAEGKSEFRRKKFELTEWVGDRDKRRK